ncbi:DUF2529 family protein, partial [Staphylococcus haemolyticus]
MSKILQTQLTGIFNRLEDQALDIQMAAPCLIQAIGGEGYVYIKGYGDLKFFEPFVIESEEHLKSSKLLSTLTTFDDIDSTDRVLLFSPYYTEEVAKDVQTLVDNDIDAVLICNRPKDLEIPEHFRHFINLATPRPSVYTEDYDKVVQPHTISFNY